MSAFVTDRQTDRHRGNSSVSFVTDRLLSCSAVALNKLKFTMKDEAVLITSAPIRAPHAPSTYPLRLRRQVYGERSDRHQEIMMMDADALHEAHPFTEDLVFNEARRLGDRHPKKP